MKKTGPIAESPPPMRNLPVVILAGGQATRMGGGDKCLLELAGQPILLHLLDRLGPGPVVLNANGDPERFAAYSMPVVSDSLDDFPGPLAGILAGLDWAAENGHDHIISVAGDTPFFPKNLVAKFEQAMVPGTILLAQSQETDGRKVRQPAFGLWPVSLRMDLRRALLDGVRKVVIWVERHPNKMVDLGVSSAFFNINRPSDLIEAQTMAGAEL